MTNKTSDKKLIKIIAGVDEAGRGPLAGDVVAAAVVLDPNNPIEGLADSKKLSAKKRELLFDEIIEKAYAYGIAKCTAVEIDDINILQASLKAMEKAVNALDCTVDLALIDGNRCPTVYCAAEAIIKGDQKEPAISAASILAKVTRDRDMLVLHETYPEYEFNIHKGYPTKKHLALLEQFGPCLIHRKTFGPVKKLLDV